MQKRSLQERHFSCVKPLWKWEMQKEYSMKTFLQCFIKFPKFYIWITESGFVMELTVFWPFFMALRDLFQPLPSLKKKNKLLGWQLPVKCFLKPLLGHFKKSLKKFSSSRVPGYCIKLIILPVFKWSISKDVYFL